MRGLRSTAIGGVVSAALACLAAAAPAWAGEYACHVKLAGEESAFVLVETDTRDAARSIAAGATARATNGRKQPVVTVLECILRHSERFAEAEVQRRFLDRGL